MLKFLFELNRFIWTRDISTKRLRRLRPRPGNRLNRQRKDSQEERESSQRKDRVISLTFWFILNQSDLTFLSLIFYLIFEFIQITI